MITQVSGTSLESLLDSTSSAFSIVNGNPLKHKGKLIKFLVEQFQLKDEYQLKALFDNQIEQTSKLNVDLSKPHHFFLSSFSHWAANKDLGAALEYLQRNAKELQVYYGATGKPDIDVNVYVVEGEGTGYSTENYRPVGVTFDHVGRFKLNMPALTVVEGINVFGEPTSDSEGYIKESIRIVGGAYNRKLDCDYKVTIEIEGYGVDSWDGTLSDAVRRTVKAAEVLGISDVEEIAFV